MQFDQAMERAVLAACARQRAGAALCLLSAAQSLAESHAHGDGWQGLLIDLRHAARRLAAQGRLVAYRGGRQVNAADMRGAYRIGLPRCD